MLYCRHGLYRSDQLIYNDLELCFKETVPQTALFDPNSHQGLLQLCSLHTASYPGREVGLGMRLVYVLLACSSSVVSLVVCVLSSG